MELIGARRWLVLMIAELLHIPSHADPSLPIFLEPIARFPCGSHILHAVQHCDRDCFDSLF